MCCLGVFFWRHSGLICHHLKKPTCSPSGVSISVSHPMLTLMLVVIKWSKMSGFNDRERERDFIDRVYYAHNITIVAMPYWTVKNFILILFSWFLTYAFTLLSGFRLIPFVYTLFCWSFWIHPFLLEFLNKIGRAGFIIGCYWYSLLWSKNFNWGILKFECQKLPQEDGWGGESGMVVNIGGEVGSIPAYSTFTPPGPKKLFCRAT